MEETAVIRQAYSDFQDDGIEASCDFSDVDTSIFESIIQSPDIPGNNNGFAASPNLPGTPAAQFNPACCTYDNVKEASKGYAFQGLHRGTSPSPAASTAVIRRKHYSTCAESSCRYRQPSSSSSVIGGQSHISGTIRCCCSTDSSAHVRFGAARYESTWSPPPPPPPAPEPQQHVAQPSGVHSMGPMQSAVTLDPCGAPSFGISFGGSSSSSFIGPVGSQPGFHLGMYQQCDLSASPYTAPCPPLMPTVALVASPPATANSAAPPPQPVPPPPLAASSTLAAKLGLKVAGIQHVNVVSGIGAYLCILNHGRVEAQMEAGHLHNAWYDVPDGCKNHAFFARGDIEQKLTNSCGITSGRIPVHVPGYRILTEGGGGGNDEGGCQGQWGMAYVISLSADRCTCGRTYSNECKHATHIRWKATKYMLAYEKPPKGLSVIRLSFSARKEGKAKKKQELWVANEPFAVLWHVKPPSERSKPSRLDVEQKQQLQPQLQFQPKQRYQPY